MTARDQARQWLAEVIHAAGHANTWRAEWIADAILDAPGVQVDEQYLDVDGSAYAWVTRDNPRATHAQVAIRLPAVPLDAANDGPSVNADGRTGAGETDGKGGPLTDTLEARLARRLPPDHPDYDAFYDATDDQLGQMLGGRDG